MAKKKPGVGSGARSNSSYSVMRLEGCAGANEPRALPARASAGDYEDQEATGDELTDPENPEFTLVSSGGAGGDRGRDIGARSLDEPACTDYVLDQLKGNIGSASDSSDDEGELGTRDLIGRDNRKKVQTTTVSPFRAVCSLVINKGGQTRVGSGLLVRNNGRTGVLTAGHNLYNNRDLGSGWVDSIEVYPGRDGTRIIDQETVRSTSQFFVSQEWMNSGNPLLDWGLVILRNDLGATNGSFALEEWIPSRLKNTFFNVVGFPSSDSTLDPEPYSMWADVGRVFWVGDKTIRYEMDTTPGNSGCPVMAFDSSRDPQNRYIVVGVHNYGVDRQYNRATKVTTALINQVISKLS